MYRVLIVDDEPTILKGLRHIVNWGDYGLEIAGQASNGTEAMEMMGALNVDILISDIKMHKSSGIELIKFVKDKGLNAKCIVLSGYDDFEYVKEAAKLGIENYLLKPVNVDELTSTLINTVEKIERETSKELVVKQGLDILRENILNRWINGDIEDHELMERGQLLNIDFNVSGYLVAAVKIFDGAPARMQSKSRLHSQSEHSANDICADVIANRARPCKSFYGPNGLSFCSPNGEVIIIFSNLAADNYGEVTKSILEKCVTRINESLNLDVFITAGSYESKFQNLHDSYANAKKLQEYRLVPPRNKIVSYGDIADSQSGEHYRRDGRVEKAGPLVRKTIDYIKANYEKNINLKTISSNFDTSAAYLGYLFNKEAGEPFTDYLNKIRVEKAKELLLGANMKIEDISKKVGYINTNYFFTIFKKTTGISPSEFKRAFS